MTFRIFVPGASALLTDHLPHGEGLICWNLLSRLAERGHDIVALTRRNAVSAPTSFEIRTVKPLAGLGATGYAIAAAREFRRLGGPRRFDLAHWIRPGGIAVSWMPQDVPGVIGPLVPPWPTDDPPPARSLAVTAARLQDVLLRDQHRRVQRRCVVLLTTPAAASTLVPGVEHRLLSFGVDAERASVAPMPTQFTVGYLGNLEVRKGVLDLADAYLRLREQMPTARLLIAGAGAADAELRRRLHGIGGVEFAGRYPPEQVGDVLRKMSVVALPSHGEPFGMTVLEAMAAGRPVIVTNAGGPPFLTGTEVGRIVPLRAPHALFEALRHFGSLDREQLEQEGRRARTRAERFSFDTVIPQLEAIYEEVVAGTQARPAG